MPPLQLARKILIIAAVEGLLLTPAHSENGGHIQSRSNSPGRHSRAPSPSSASGTIQIDYKTDLIKPLLGVKAEYKKKDREAAVEAYGIAGLLKVSPQNSFLIAITSRQQVALINRVPVYVITDVALIPLSSQSSAQAAISKAKEHRIKRTSSGDGVSDTDTSDEEGADGLGEDLAAAENKPVAAIAAGEVDVSKDEDRAKPVSHGDAIGQRGVYGKFAQKWFSKSGWTAERKTASIGHDNEQSQQLPTTDPSEPGNQDIFDPVVSPPDASINHKPENQPADQAEVTTEQSTAVENVKDSVAHSLTPKLLHTTRLLLASSRSFFFSYDMDITRHWGQEQRGADPEAPLWKKVDPYYFWNRHLIRPFTDANQHSFVLPLMQGFVNQRTFYATVSPTSQKTSSTDGGDSDATATRADPSTTAKSPFIFTIISRRSIKRAGLRYLRRGVDTQGNVANNVETEQLLTVPSPATPDNPEWIRTYSFLQIRGSIPIFFQQSPYALRPRPTLLHGEEQNRLAFKKHFDHVKERYGDVFCVSLVERGSAERIVGEKYEKYAEEFNAEGKHDYRIGFEWFDFHKVCKGMRFEKVSELLEGLEDMLNKFGWTEVLDSGHEKVGAQENQHGTVKSSQKGLMRTNCMDCLDRTNVVQSAFARRALEHQLALEGVSLSDSPTEWFNLLWADNGDAISKQYASTAALKGDFTRTRKRNYRGALTDLGLTMSRYFTNIISDFFTQAAIDFLLGNVSNKVFDEFEANMMSSDPAVSMAEIRKNAVEISTRIVIADDTEEPIQGWTFLTPHEENTLRTFPFQENVLLLTNKAIYSCRFDFAMEKVSAFERIDLRHIEELQVGAYITSTLATSSTDTDLNVGFVVKYKPGKNDFLRVNTRSLRSSFPKDPSPSSKENSPEDADAEDTPKAGPGKDVIPIDSHEGAGSNKVSVVEKPLSGSTRFVAFKALPQGSAILTTGTSSTKEEKKMEKGDVTETESQKNNKEISSSASSSLHSEIMLVVQTIEKAAKNAARSPSREEHERELGGVSSKEEGGEEGGGGGGGGRERGEGSLINEEDIISLAAAKKKTGYLEQWGYSLRRLVWA